MNPSEQTPSRQLIDPSTGHPVQLVYAVLPQFSSGPEPEDTSTSLFELAQRVVVRWKLVAALTVLGAAIGLTIALTTPDRFTASATALPPPDKAGSGGMMSQYAGLAAVAGLSLPGSPNNSVDVIMAILSSRRLSEPLIERFALRDYYQSTTRDAVISDFALNFSARNDKKSNTITISFTHRNPETAAAVTNAAAEMLRDIYNKISQSSATREREFLEQRMAQTEVELSKASKAMAEFKALHHTIEIESQTKATIEAVAKLEGELTAQQIELRALLASQASTDNPRTQLLQERIKAMTEEMTRLLGGEPGPSGNGRGVLLSLGSLPELSITYVERYRAVKRCEAVLGALTSQLESARINEVRSSEVVTIVDPAFVPELKSGPVRSRICILATVIACVAGCFAAIMLPTHRRRQSVLGNAP